MRSLLIVVLLACSQLAAADTGRDRLQAFVKQVQSLEALFTQTVRDPNGKVTQEASGQFRMQRPGRFRWHYQKPYEQLLVGDGNKLWIYDKDLQQVTVKEMRSAIGNTPALLLSGAVNLQDNFIIGDVPAVQAPAADSLQWVELQPRDAEAGFSKLRLGFDGSVIKSMELFDNFGQTTLLRFHDSHINLPLDADNFRFKPPAGVDVIEDF